VTPPPIGALGYTVSLTSSFALAKPTPNPVQNDFSVRFPVVRTTKVEIGLYDINGRKVKMQVSGIKESGVYNVTVNCQDFPNGAYILKMKTGDYTAIEKFVVTK